MRQRLWRNITSLAAIVIVALATVVVIPAKPAEAAWGYVQIKVQTPWYVNGPHIRYVKVEGWNQYGSWSTWERSSSYATSSMSTSGWWWKLRDSTTHYITVHFDTGAKYRCASSTGNWWKPELWTADWYTVSIDLNGSIGNAGSCWRI